MSQIERITGLINRFVASMPGKKGSIRLHWNGKRFEMMHVEIMAGKTGDKDHIYREKIKLTD